jgi:tetratricopeptide (TPR) repeat protein
MHRIWGILAIAAALALAAPARAAGDDERVAEAQRHFEAGMASFHLDEYDKAIDEWEAGYRIKPAPQFLYNIAQAYRLSSRPERALSFYQKYLRLDPKARNRVECERHIATLTALVEAQRHTDKQPPTPAPPLVAAPVVSPTPAPPEHAVATPSPLGGADLHATAPARSKPVYRKPWFWVAVVGGAVVVAGAVTLGVVLGGGGGGSSSSSNEQSLPPARF